MNKLSKRLQVVANLIQDNKKIIDIGCDHGLLSIYLAEKYKNIRVTVQNPCLLQDDLSVPSKSSCQSFISADTVLPACANV